MKVAIPTDDKALVARHFGRTAGFMVFELEAGKVLSKEYKVNDFTGHAQGMHQHSHHHEGHGHHSHESIFNALVDTEIVIAGGMGRRLYDDFERKNIKVFITQEPDIDKALEAFMNNTLDNNYEGCCEH